MKKLVVNKAEECLDCGENEMIPLFKVYMRDSVGQAVNDVLYSGYVGEGEYVKKFEGALGRVVGNENVVAVNSCTSALMMSLRMAGVEQGDFVATTPMTCLATNEPILALGAQPVWVDINPWTGCLDKDDLREVLKTYGWRVKAAICVDWAGYPCDLNEIYDVCKESKTFMIQDAAHDLGAIYEDFPVGRTADFTCFSFQAIKTLTTIDGGLIACKEIEFVKRAKLMRWFGLDRSLGPSMRCVQDPIEYGYKFHMNNVNAVIGLENLKDFEYLLEQRRLIAQVYQKNLYDLDKVKLLKYENNRTSSYWLFTLRVDNPDKFIPYMVSHGVMCSQVHVRNDNKRMFKDSYKRELPGVDEFSRHHVSIPIGHWLEVGDIEYIVDKIRRY